MDIDLIIKDLSSYIIKTKDIIFFGEFMYIASLTDDELDDAFYHYLKDFINCYLFYVFNPGIVLTDNDKFIFRRFFLMIKDATKELRSSLTLLYPIFLTRMRI